MLSPDEVTRIAKNLVKVSSREKVSPANGATPTPKPKPARRRPRATPKQAKGAAELPPPADGAARAVSFLRGALSRGPKPASAAEELALRTQKLICQWT